MLWRMPVFPLIPSSSSVRGQQRSATNRTKLSDLCILSPSQTNVQEALGSVSTNEVTALTKSTSVRVELKYGILIRPSATSRKAMRLTVPCRMYSNSTRDGFPGIAGFVGALRSNAWIAVISSTDIVYFPSCLALGAF